MILTELFTNLSPSLSLWVYDICYFMIKLIFYNSTRKVCIVFTDGDATDAKDVPAAAQKWAKAGVTVFAVGIGNGIHQQGNEANIKWGLRRFCFPYQIWIYTAKTEMKVDKADLIFSR